MKQQTAEQLTARIQAAREALKSLEGSLIDLKRQTIDTGGDIGAEVQATRAEIETLQEQHGELQARLLASLEAEAVQAWADLPKRKQQHADAVERHHKGLGAALRHACALAESDPHGSIASIGNEIRLCLEKLHRRQVPGIDVVYAGFREASAPVRTDFNEEADAIARTYEPGTANAMNFIRNRFKQLLGTLPPSTEQQPVQGFVSGCKTWGKREAAARRGESA